MEIIIGKTAGFCFGVANAVNKTKESLKKYKELYCLGELVHNKDVTNELKNEGLVFINEINDGKGNVIIRAHGEPQETYKRAKELNLNIIDLTCPKVIKIHDIVKEYSKNGYYIFLIGQKEHPETIGTKSYCGKNVDIIENEMQVDNAICRVLNSKIKKVLVISQTTFSVESFDDIIKAIISKIGSAVQIEVKNTICDATKLRQEETLKIAQKVDAMIIIGGKNSSNTNKLYKIAKEHCKNSILIENEKELDITYIKKYKKIGVMAGASTPQKSIELLVEKLNKIC